MIQILISCKNISMEGDQKKNNNNDEKKIGDKSSANFSSSTMW